MDDAAAIGEGGGGGSPRTVGVGGGGDGSDGDGDGGEGGNGKVKDKGGVGDDSVGNIGSKDLRRIDKGIRVGAGVAGLVGGDGRSDDGADGGTVLGHL